MDNNYKPYRAPGKGVVTLAQMQSAIQQGDYQQVKTLLARFKLGRFPPHRQDIHAWTFLNEAVTRRYPLIAKLLLAKFKKVNFPTNVGKPLILTAVQQKDVGMIATLAEFGADFNISYYRTTPLSQALSSKWMSGVECLLQKGANPNFCGECSETPLHFAVKQGNLELLYCLLENGANLNVHDAFKQTPLHLAVKGGNFEMVKFMIEKGAEVKIQGKSNQTPLNLAVEGGNLEMVKFLVEKGADVNTQGEFGQTSLHSALRGGTFKMVKFLVEKGADVKIQNKWNQTPLHLAIEGGNFEVVEFLIEKGADVNTRDESGQTPLHLALRGGTFKMVKFLVEKQADVKIQDKFNQTPLHLALKGGNFEIIKFLVENGADMNIQGESGQTPLHLAVKSGNFEMTKFLVERGADVNVLNRFGQTLLHFAVTNENLEILQFILEKYPYVNIQDNSNQTPLHIAVEKGNLEFVKLLLDRGANFEAETISGKRSLHLAASNNHLEISNYLLEKGAYVNATDQELETPLLASIKPNNEGIVRLLVSKGADINVRTSSNGSLLHCASSVDSGVLKFLLQMGLDENLNDDNGRTPLFYSAKHNKLENVQILLKHGARLSTEDKDHKDLLELAHESTSEILELILEYHPNLYLRGQRALRCFLNSSSVKDNNSECSDYSDYSDFSEEEEQEREINNLKNVILLVERGLDANMEITYGSVKSTLLFHAMQKSRDLVVRVLEAGANVNQVSSCANESYHDDYYYYKSRYPYDYYDCDEYNENEKISPLYAATLAKADDKYEFESGPGLVTTLLQYGANVNDLPGDFDENFSEESLSSDDDDTREFIRHIALMMDQDLEVDGSISDRITDEFTEFYEKCEQEIEELKTEQFGETSLTFFDVLTNDATQLAEFLRNKSVIDELEAAEYEDQFPIYGSAITSQLAMGLRRRKLLDKAAQNCYTVFPCLPRSVSEEIFSHLENKDVSVLLLACQAAKSRPWEPKQ